MAGSGRCALIGSTHEGTKTMAIIRGTDSADNIFGVVHFSDDFGLHGRVKPPACEGRILVGGPPVRKVVSLCVSLARLGSLWLKRSQTQQGEPVRMALPSHHFVRAFALALRASTADEAVMVQVKLQ